MVLEKSLQRPLDSKKIKPVNPKGNQPWRFIGRTDAEAEAPIFWPPDAKCQLIWKDPDAGKDWRQEKGMAENVMVRWHHQLTGHEFEQTLGDSGGQGSLHAAVHGVTKSRIRLNDWRTTIKQLIYSGDQFAMYWNISVLHALTVWRRKWQPTPVFLPGESQGRGSLMGCRLWGRTESDTTEVTWHSISTVLKEKKKKNYSSMMLLFSKLTFLKLELHPGTLATGLTWRLLPSGDWS